jgi:hydrogenase-4 component E
MSLWTESLLVLLVLTNLWLLGGSRLANAIAAVAAQGILLAVLPLLLGLEAPTWRLALQAGLNICLKGIVFPLLLLRAVRSVGARREVEPFVGYSLSLLIGVALVGVSLYLGSRLPALASGRSTLLVPATLFTALTGLFTIIARKSAIVQALGTWPSPFPVEMGIFLDAFMAVFVMGITIYHINREFDHIDSDQLASLKD